MAQTGTALKMHHRQRKSYETLVQNNKSEPILFPDISMRNAGTCSHISPHRFQVQRSESRPDTIRLTHMRSVKSFLVSQSGDNTDHHLLCINFQPKLLLKCKFIFHLFFSKVLYCIISCNMDIRARIIFFIVNTIDNSGQTVTSCIISPSSFSP